MAIRIRRVNGILIALCAARSIPQEGDIYLDDGVHDALSTKFALDFNRTFDCDLPYDKTAAPLIEIEESNNPNRADWDAWMLEMETLPAASDNPLT